MILFKMHRYGLSDVQTEYLTMDSISFCRFCGLELMDGVPDHSTLTRFRSELTRSDFRTSDFVGLKSQLIDNDFVKKTQYATKRYFSEINQCDTDGKANLYCTLFYSGPWERSWFEASNLKHDISLSVCH